MPRRDVSPIFGLVSVQLSSWLITRFPGTHPSRSCPRSGTKRASLLLPFLASLSESAVERIWHIQDSQGRIMAWAVRSMAEHDISCSLCARQRPAARHGMHIQGYLTRKKHPPPRNLQQDYTRVREEEDIEK